MPGFHFIHQRLQATGKLPVLRRERFESVLPGGKLTDLLPTIVQDHESGSNPSRRQGGEPVFDLLRGNVVVEGIPRAPTEVADQFRDLLPRQQADAESLVEGAGGPIDQRERVRSGSDQGRRAARRRGEGVSRLRDEFHRAPASTQRAAEGIDGQRHDHDVTSIGPPEEEELGFLRKQIEVVAHFGFHPESLLSREGQIAIHPWECPQRQHRA